MTMQRGNTIGRTAGLVLATMLVAAVTAAAARAGVHDGGVGACSYCHVMHETEGGAPGGGGGGGGIGNSLLRDGPASDICLSCHADAYGAVLGTSPLAPPPERGPGNFVFLTEDNLNDGPDGVLNPIHGDAAGHNIRAPGHGLATDGTRVTSPGGTYPSSTMRCTSCHDPHGNNNYRFLRGPGASPGGGGSFPYNAPDATGLDLETGGVESDSQHIAYRADVSNWCGNCHGAYLNDHNEGVSAFGHPVDNVLEGGVIQQYNVYNGTLDPAGGVAATAYLAAVPFEDVGMSVTSTEGPTVSSGIHCLTCHRAHASSAPASGRWDFAVPTLGQDGVVSGSYAIPNPYGDPSQTSLCYKCHPSGSD
jgi:predicted CXXCH cytochrome family protein